MVACFNVIVDPPAIVTLGARLPLVHQAALQVGGHGERLHQCREVVLTTFKTVPVQVSTHIHQQPASSQIIRQIYCVVTYRSHLAPCGLLSLQQTLMLL